MKTDTSTLQDAQDAAEKRLADELLTSGLTKREFAAIEIAARLSPNADLPDLQRRYCAPRPMKPAEYAVRLADSVLDELGKTKPE